MGADAVATGQRIPVPASPCLSAVDGLGWQPEPFAVRAGRYDLGVRGNSPVAQELAMAVAGDRVVDAGDESMPRNLSVHLAESPPDGGRTIDLHRLYLGHHLVLRTRDPHRVLAALDSHLDAHALTHDPERAQLAATAVVRDGRAHLLPTASRRRVVDHARRYAAAGYLLVDRPWVEVDLGAGELVVAPSSIDVDEVAVPDSVATGDAVPAVRPGRYPILSIAVAEGTAGEAVLDLGRAVVNLAQLDAGATLTAVHRLVAAAAGVPGPLDGPLG